MHGAAKYSKAASVLGGVIIRGPDRIDVKLGGANVFIAPAKAEDAEPPVTPTKQVIPWRDLSI